MTDYYDRLGDLLKDRLDSDEDPFDAWTPHGGKIRKAGNIKEKMPPPKKNSTTKLIPVPKELVPEFIALNVAVGSPLEHCKQQWKALLKEYHPDLAQSNEKERKKRTEKTLTITKAYKRIALWYETGTY